MTDLTLPGQLPAPEKRDLTLGFVPLVDACPLIVAQERGFFADCGLHVQLSREASWASIRDKLELGLLDAAQIPAGIPLAAAFGLGYGQRPLVCSMGLGLNGNAITVSAPLYEALQSAPSFAAEPAAAGQALRDYLQQNPDRQLTLATVYTHSMHSFLLQYWLDACRIDRARIRLVVVPPPQMVDALRRGLIDGFCAGEPWNSVARQQGVGEVLVSGYQIWRNAPDKVLGSTADWAAEHPASLQLVIMALLRACAWLDDPDNAEAKLGLLRRPEYLGEGLTAPDPDIGRHRFFGAAANFPWLSHARWLLEQIQRDQPHRHPAEIDALARQTYRSDIFRQAAAALNLNLPLTESKPEGAHEQDWTVDGSLGPLALPGDRLFDRPPAEEPH
ncbi:CmpA/NrtA family ABC transporter substrate-binding protein [Marinobacterium aestuariivivens]|uniref:CmpA/NrtA family ABC transporter substrate-binding protein n=1 Tax=Marinobacterium aestuariivivens TaxID=1698799 RepID=A0ABW2A599_9GAMM